MKHKQKYDRELFRFVFSFVRHVSFRLGLFANDFRFNGIRHAPVSLSGVDLVKHYLLLAAAPSFPIIVFSCRARTKPAVRFFAEYRSRFSLALAVFGLRVTWTSTMFEDQD